PPGAASLDTGPPGNRRAAVSLSFSFPPVGRDVPPHLHRIVPISIGDRPFHRTSPAWTARRSLTSGPLSGLSRRALDDARFWASLIEGRCLAKRAVQGSAQRPFSWILQVGAHPVEDVRISYLGMRVGKTHGSSRSRRSKRARMAEGVLRAGLHKPKRER